MPVLCDIYEVRQRQQHQQDLEKIRKKDRALYEKKVEEYNNLVSEYNSLILEIKTLIDQYNHQAKLFNECAASIN